VARASNYQTAHAVSDQTDFLDGDRERLGQAFEEQREVAPVLTNLATRIVADVQARQAKLAFEQRAVRECRILPERPARFGERHAVHQNHDARLDGVERRLERLSRQSESLARAIKAHINRQSVASLCEIVAHYRVQNRSFGVESVRWFQNPSVSPDRPDLRRRRKSARELAGSRAFRVSP
jgi:hypothetical protein